jgi:hypothetical protein
MVSRADEAAEILLNFEEFTEIEPARQCLRHLQLNYREASAIRDKIGHYLEVFLRMDKQTIGNKLPDEKFYYAQ